MDPSEGRFYREAFPSLCDSYLQADQYERSFNLFSDDNYSVIIVTSSSKSHNLCPRTLNCSLYRVINFQFPLHHKYNITQYEELGFS